jgi:hypothetical protein
VRAPRTPAWLIRAGLMDRLYEARAAFEIAWVVERWKLAPQLRIRPVAAEPPRRGAIGTPANQALWTELLRTATLTVEDDAVCARLEQYGALGPEPTSDTTAV